MKFGWFAVAIWTVMIGGCDKREQQNCRMANEYVVAKSVSAPRALDVVQLDTSRTGVFWSADKKSYFAVINNEGIPQTKPLVLTPSGTSVHDEKTFWKKHRRYSLDAVAISATQISSDKMAVSLLCQAGDNATEVMTVLIDVAAYRVERIARVGKSGLYARQVSQAMQKGALVVGWPDTTQTPQKVRMLTLNAQTLDVISEETITRKEAVFGPSLQSNGAAAVALWSTVVGKSVKLYATPLNKLNQGADQLIDTLELFHADAHVVPYQNGFAAVYRDNRDKDRTEEFYYAVLDANGARTMLPKRISRADGPQGPKLSVGENYLFSAAIRSYNNNYLVGFNRFEPRGTKLGGEFQVYADKCDFIRTGMVTSGDKVVLVYAENADSGGRILASTLSCDKKK